MARAIPTRGLPAVSDLTERVTVKRLRFGTIEALLSTPLQIRHIEEEQNQHYHVSDCYNLKETALAKLLKYFVTV
jgi:hypothetical protein